MIVNTYIRVFILEEVADTNVTIIKPDSGLHFIRRPLLSINASFCLSWPANSFV